MDVSDYRTFSSKIIKIATNSSFQALSEALNVSRWRGINKIRPQVLTLAWLRLFHHVRAWAAPPEGRLLRRWVTTVLRMWKEKKAKLKRASRLKYR